MRLQRHVVPDPKQTVQAADRREDLVRAAHRGSHPRRQSAGNVTLARREDAGPIVASDGQFIRAVETHNRGHVHFERLRIRQSNHRRAAR